MTIKLSDMQLVLLSAAAQREDRCLVASQQLKSGAAKKVADKLLAAGLVREIKAKGDIPIWRRDDDEGQNYALKLTAAGMKAIAVDDDAPAAPDQAANGESPAADHQIERTPKPPTSKKAPDAVKKLATVGRPRSETVSNAAPREGTKLSSVIALLQRRHGATLAEVIAATDWLPHTARAALTGLRKRGFEVSLDKSDKTRGSVYRIGAAAEQEAA